MLNLWLLIRQLKALVRIDDNGKVLIDTHQANPLMDKVDEMGFRRFVLARLAEHARYLEALWPLV